jgi:hypothetical protein
MPMPRKAYTVQKADAKARNIPFLLTFEQWWAVWVASGHWEQRGRRADQYCMARKRDRGGYTVGNVIIITNAENSRMVRENWSEAHYAKWLVAIVKVGKANAGKLHPKLGALNRSRKGKLLSAEHRQAMRDGWERRRQRLGK